MVELAGGPARHFTYKDYFGFENEYIVTVQVTLNNSLSFLIGTSLFRFRCFPISHIQEVLVKEPPYRVFIVKLKLL